MNWFTLALLIGIALAIYWRYYGPGRRRPAAPRPKPRRPVTRADDPAVTQLEYDPKTGTYRPSERNRR